MDQAMRKERRKKFIIRVIFASLALIVIGMIFFLFRNFILDILRLTKEKNEEGLRQFMQDKGWIGYIAVVIIEALEMVVVFIPAEFIQIPAGLSFNFFVAVGLCDLGVCLGASIIYFMVHTLKFNNEFIERSQKRIKTLANKQKGKNTQILMYFLFVTPIVPFGAICYFASSRKISYRRYMLTCATGVIPSIVTSIIMGTSLKYFLAQDLKLWVLILIILGLGSVLFIGMILISKKFLRGNKKFRGTPESSFTPLAGFLFSFYVKSCAKLKLIEDEKYERMLDIETGKLYLANHSSQNDSYHCYKALFPDRPAQVVNRYYTRFGITRWFLKRLGFIPKSLYNPDLEAVKAMMKYAKEDTSILMFPEARLSLDATSNPITNGTSQLAKKLKMPIVLIDISGNYYASSKVRKAKRRNPVEFRVKEIIEADKVNELSVEELDKIIKDNLRHDDASYTQRFIYKDKNKAENLEHVLYHCPKCGKDYTMKSDGNTISCECGFKLELDEHYYFKENEFGLKTIHDYYSLIKAHEKEYILNTTSNLLIEQEVKVVKISFKGKKYDAKGWGVTKVTKHGFEFSGEVDGEEVSFSYSLDYLQALPFSVNKEYECYYNNELYYFYPENGTSCTRVCLIYDLLQEDDEVKEKIGRLNEK